MKHIIITGAGGLVATQLTLHLLEKTDAQIYLLSTHIDKIQNRYRRYSHRIRCYTLSSFHNYAHSVDTVFDICIHAAFSRSSNGDMIVASLDYQRHLLEILKELEIKSFVNISSQSVYGKTFEPLWKEDTPLDPDYLYAMGKYSSEVITELMLDRTNISWTNIRLCSVCENVRFVRIFVQNAIEGKPIHLTTPDYQCSFIDARDVADALLAFIYASDKVALSHTYNLGANLVHSIRDIAEKVKFIGQNQYGIKEVVITEQKSDNYTRIGVDSSKFMKTFSWKPKYDMDDMVKSMFEMLINPNGWGVSA